MIGRCANSACHTDFDHNIGGKFFRFHLIETEVSEIPDATKNPHKVVHYWLCSKCSKKFTLAHVEAGKVALRLLEQEFEMASQHRLTPV
jgi:hypothetical protein